MKQLRSFYQVSVLLAFAGVAHAADTVRMTAKPGTILTGSLKSTTRVLDMQSSVTPQPGQKVSKAELEQYQKSFASVPKNQPASVQTIPGTLKVLPAKADGSVPVQMGLQIPNPQTGKNTTITMTTLYAKNGKTTIKLEPVKDPLMQKVMQGLSDSLLGNKELQLFYNKAWNVGESVTQTVSLPFDRLTGGAPVKFTGDFKVTTKTTYKGKNAAGEYIFQSTSTSKSNVLKATDEKGKPIMQMTISNLSGTSETRIRPDGLPSYSKTNQTMTLSMTMNNPDLPVQIKNTTRLQTEQLQTWKQK